MIVFDLSSNQSIQNWTWRASSNEIMEFRPLLLKHQSPAIASM